MYLESSGSRSTALPTEPQPLPNCVKYISTPVLRKAIYIGVINFLRRKLIRMLMHNIRYLFAV